ncbi:TrmB family transcriptional regulator [Candidatus Pacearchaeota archaeon]|nr:TrmB family transcriptional regulator [Candidatus Pacearchaeota archaeon]
MIAKQELIKKLKGYFDLNIYETKVWLALLSKGISSAGEVSELSGVPRSRTYDVFESLEKQGFVIQKLGKPVKYLAVKPEIVIEKLKNKTIKHTEEKVKTLSSLKDTEEYKELKKLHNTGIEPTKNHELSTSIKGRSNLYLQMKALMESSEKMVYVTSSAYELLSKQKMFKDVFTKLKARRVDIKVMISEDEEEAKKLSTKFGVPIKSKPINARFVISDKTELIFTIKPTNVHEDFDYGVWINSPFFINSLVYLFDIAWKD